MKLKNKIFIAIFLLIILIANVSFASYDTVTMEVVEEPICTIQIGEKSKFEKKLINKDLTNKEVTIQLQVTNEEVADKTSGELILVLDNSDSMTVEVSAGKTRKDLIFESAKKIVTDLLKDNNNLKIGVVSFSTNSDQTKEGTASDATLVSALSTDSTSLNASISNIVANGARTNLQSGLLLASQQFTTAKNNKYMIILTDGVPNVAVDYDKHYYSDDVINKTVKQLTTLKEQGVQISTMLTKVDDSYVPAGVTKDFGTIIKEIFGTSEKPSFGKFYYVDDDKIEKTITEDIYNSLLPVEKTLKDIKVVDYFPKEIIDNFDFSYVSKANIGNISSSVDTKNNSITWNIPELESGKTATVQYKLKLKKDFDSAIVDKLLNTNEKESIDYTNFDGKSESETSTISPKLKLTEPPAILPQTGSIALLGFGILAVTLVVLSTIKLITLYKKMN